MKAIKPGIYRHFKNKKLYRVLGTAVHTETLEDLVAYEPLYANELLAERGASLFVRPLSMFAGEVEHEGVTQPRFRFEAESSEGISKQ